MGCQIVYFVLLVLDALEIFSQFHKSKITPPEAAPKSAYIHRSREQGDWGHLSSDTLKKGPKWDDLLNFTPRGTPMENPDLKPHLWASCLFSSDNTQFDQKFQSNDDQDLSEQLPPKVSWQVFSEACMPNRGKIATYCPLGSG